MKTYLWKRVVLAAAVVALALALSGASRETTATDWCSGGVCQEWVARYNGPDSLDDMAKGLALDASGNVYVTGWANWNWDPLEDSTDYGTVKYNASGVQQWASIRAGYFDCDLSEPSWSYAEALAVDAPGNAYVTGYVACDEVPTQDYCTVWYNPSGVPVRERCYGGPDELEEMAKAITVDASGNVYVTGMSVGSGTSFDYATVKYNSAGEEWARRYNGPGNGEDWATAIAVDGSGSVYVTGYSTGSGTGYDYATVKYNASGVEQWAIRYGGSGEDKAQDLAVDASGNVYVTGYRFFSFPRMDDYVTIKYNASGVQQWATPYDASLNDRASSLALDASGNVYVTGSSGLASDLDYATVKYNSAGTEQWARTYDGPGDDDDEATGLAVDSSGNAYVTGYSTGTGGNYDYATVKYNASGAQQWGARYDGPGADDDEATDLAVDSSGNVYVTGYSTGTGGNYDYATIKYSEGESPPVGVGGIAELPDVAGGSPNETVVLDEGSAWSGVTYAAMAAGVTAAALALAGGAWYVRRRWRC